MSEKTMSEMEQIESQACSNLDIIIKRVQGSRECNGNWLSENEYRYLLDLTYCQRSLIVDALASDVRYTTFHDRD